MSTKKFLLRILFLFLFIVTNYILSLKPNDVFAQTTNTYYVSTTGSDTNNGTSPTTPFKTFAKSNTAMSAGSKLYILGGTYSEKLIISKSGTSSSPIEVMPYQNQTVVIDGTDSKANLIDMTGSFINVSGIEVKNSNGYCVNIIGNDSKVSGLKVHDCSAMGIYTHGKRNSIIGNKVYLASMVNSGRTMNVGWGSGIKVRIGGEGILIEDNEVYNNYGEGIAVTRASNSIVRNNRIYDNFSANVYIDNSYDIVVEGNLAYCTTNTDFDRDGHRPYGFAIGEESYTGWGAQLARVTIKNNISTFCYKGIASFNSDVSGGGLDTVLLLNNTLWGNTKTGISLAYDSTKQRNTVVANNIIHQPEANLVYIENNTGITVNNNFLSSNKDTGSAVGQNNKYVKDTSSIFVSTPSYVADSYKLISGSLAINMGASLPSVTNDYFGSVRPIGGVYDAGAHEYGGTTTSSPTPSPTPNFNIADLEPDGDVDGTDYNTLVSNFNLTGILGWIRSDIIKNGIVDIFDFNKLITNFGQ